MLKSVLRGLVLYGLNRLAEQSTWKGMVVIATAAGVSISPELATQIVTGGTAAVGFIHAVFPEQKSVSTGN